MKNKGALIEIIAIVVILAILGVVFMTSQKKEEGTQVSGTEQKNETTQNAYKFVEDGKNVNLGVDFKTLDMGEPTDYFEQPSCAFEGIDKVYTYSHYEINTYPEGETDKVKSIYFLDGEVKTEEGAKIGDSFEKMVEIYGENYKNSETQYTYEKGKTQINFIVEDNVITSIEYTYVTE